MNNTAPFIIKYDKYIIAIGIIIVLTGFALEIAAGTMNQQVQISEKKLRTLRPKNFDKELEKLFDKRIEISSYGYIGLILVTIGFIFNNIIHTIMIRKKI